MKTRKKAIFAKIESTYGTDSVPTATDAIETSGLQRNMYEGNVVTREIDRATLGADETVNTAPYVMLEFRVALAGAGSVGDVPRYGPLLRACGFAETINASTNVEYDPVSDGFESCTIYYERDGERQIATGCRGTVTFQLSTGGYPEMVFRMTGLYNRPTPVTALVADLTGIPSPAPVNRRNTGTCTLGAYNLRLQSMTLNMGAETPHLDLVNFEEVLYVDRAPAAEMVYMAPEISEIDIMGLVESHLGVVPKSALQVIHGQSAGNQIQIDAPQLQLSGISETDINGEQGYQSNGIFLPNAGDDEFRLTVQ